MKMHGEQQAESILNSIGAAYSSMGSNNMASLDEFFLSEDECEEWFTKEPNKRAKTFFADGDIGSKWTLQHANFYRAKGISWPPSTDHLREACGRRVQVSRRESEIIYMMNELHPVDPASDVEVTVDISQSIDRVAQGIGIVHCLTPGQKVFLRRRMRFLLGEESLRIQGLWAEDAAIIKSLSDKQLQDLAGNAFCSVSFASAFLALMSGL